MSEIPDGCELSKMDATSTEIKSILKMAKTIAVVGLSPKEDRPSHRIAKYLLGQGYRVIGVNPGQSEILGEKVYKSVADIPESVDIVDIFLRPESISLVVEESITKKAKVIWMQEGIVNNQAADRAKAAGLQVVMNKCIAKEHAAAF